MNDERLRWALERIEQADLPFYDKVIAAWALEHIPAPRLDREYAATFKLKRDG